jgi:hypothetical protein
LAVARAHGVAVNEAVATTNARSFVSPDVDAVLQFADVGEPALQESYRLMRYAALVSLAESVDFGPRHVLSPGSTRVQARLSDEALYALARYIYSLEPPPNPNPRDDKAVAGERIFQPG